MDALRYYELDQPRIVTLAGQREKLARTIAASAPGDLISLFARRFSEATSTK